MEVDSTLAFAARRNIPIRYNRELVSKTLTAMQRVEEIRLKRERRFYKQRMYGNKSRSLEEDRKLVEENQHLLPPEERYAFESKLETMDEDQDIAMAVDMEEQASEMSFEGFESEEEVEESTHKTVKTKAKTKMKLTVDGSIEADDD
jgi:large subunit ribosomal protein L24e